MIVGLSHEVNQPEMKRLFSYDDIKGEPEETQAKYLSPYLFDASGLKDRHSVLVETGATPNNRPLIVAGSQPIDFGHYVMSTDDKNSFLAKEPQAEKFIIPYFGAREFLNGGEKWVLAPFKANPNELKKMPYVLERVAQVRASRERSKRKSTLVAAQYPKQFGTAIIPEKEFIVIPKVSSERRKYMPMGYVKPPSIPSDLVFVGADSSLSDFSILTSSTHMAWMRAVAGRLESRYRYSIGVVYNTFPWPDLTDAAKATLTKTGQAILDARAAWPEATLADLYDPDSMPANLRKAHIANDKAVDKLYRKKPFESERERVEHLFMLYEQLQAPLVAASKPKPRKRKARTVKTS